MRIAVTMRAEAYFYATYFLSCMWGLTERWHPAPLDLILPNLGPGAIVRGRNFHVGS